MESHSNRNSSTIIKFRTLHGSQFLISTSSFSTDTTDKNASVATKCKQNGGSIQIYTGLNIKFRVVFVCEPDDSNLSPFVCRARKIWKNIHSQSQTQLKIRGKQSRTPTLWLIHFEMELVTFGHKPRKSQNFEGTQHEYLRLNSALHLLNEMINRKSFWSFVRFQLFNRWLHLQFFLM